jgi:hypothetical protein
MKPIINSLPRKFIEEYSACYKADIQNYEYNGQIYHSGFGAEIFNNVSNKAIGDYSHAEGSQTKTIGSYSHAEGSGTEAVGMSSHAEGSQTKAIGVDSHSEGFATKALGDKSHAEGNYTEASGDITHAEGWDTIANTPFLHVQGLYNIPEENPTLFYWGVWNTGNQIYDGERIVYIYNQQPSLNKTTGVITTGDTTEKTIKELKVGDYFSFTNYANSIIDNFLCAREFIGSEVDSETNSTSYTWVVGLYEASPRNTLPGKYLHIVGNGDVNKRSNAHTIESDGTAWYQGDIYVGSTSGVNRDEGSKKLATEEYVNQQINIVPTQVQADWNQNDESAIDFIKNRPFGDTGEFDFIPLFENGVFDRINSNVYFGEDLPGNFILGTFYKVIFNEKEYICEAKKEK